MSDGKLSILYKGRFLVIAVLHFPSNTTYTTQMDHITPVRRSLEDTARHGGLFVIFKVLRWRGKVLLEDQVSNPYNLPRKFVKTHTCSSHSAANRLRCGSMGFHDKAM
jgi:hypothetical protein